MTPSSTIEFLIWLLIAASIIAVIAARLRIPYTVALVLGGLLLGSFHLPITARPLRSFPRLVNTGCQFSHFSPALLFEGSLKIQFRHLRESLVPICLLATVGSIGGNFDLWLCAPLGAWNSHSHCTWFSARLWLRPTPSRCSPFSRTWPLTRDSRSSWKGRACLTMEQRLSCTGFSFGAVASSHLAYSAGIRDFVVEVAGGAAVGAVLGYVFSSLHRESKIRKLRSRLQPSWHTVPTFSRNRCICRGSLPPWPQV